MRTGLTIRRRLLMMLSALTILVLLIGVRIGNLTRVQGAALTARGVRVAGCCKSRFFRLIAVFRRVIHDSSALPFCLMYTEYVRQLSGRDRRCGSWSYDRCSRWRKRRPAGCSDKGSGASFRRQNSGPGNMPDWKGLLLFRFCCRSWDFLLVILSVRYPPAGTRIHYRSCPEANDTT